MIKLYINKSSIYKSHVQITSTSTTPETKNPPNMFSIFHSPKIQKNSLAYKKNIINQIKSSLKIRT